jgi:peroxiredoxin Q/BCP
MMMLNVGDTAPDFQLPDQQNVVVTLDEVTADGPVILYFYPADFSPLCTAEACAFRDRFEDVSQLGVRIVGISRQSPTSHRRFAKAFSLPFPLLSDVHGRTIADYGVAGPFGFGVRRATFLIDEAKIIRNRVVSDLFVGSHTDLIKQTIVSHSTR